jgi:hypothetical protein
MIKGRVYAIECCVSGKRYIGSTKKTLTQRLVRHRINYKAFQAGTYNYVTVFDVLGAGNYEIVLLEEVNVDSKKELRQRERHYIQSQACVNSNVPTRTGAEYYKDNQERYATYREQNKDKIKKYKATYYEQNKDKIKACEVTYREQNKNNIKKYKATWYEQNKEKIKERVREKIMCPCGSSVGQSNKVRHEKSKKHQTYLKNLSG